MNKIPLEEWWIEEAVETAKESTCAKSKRGAIIAHPRATHFVVAANNSPPPGYRCGEDIACASDCNKIAVHAEERAIIQARRSILPGSILIHAKVDHEGKLAFSGGPSCWQCSRMIVESQIGYVWLYHQSGWKAYQAGEFHELTLINCGLPVNKYLKPVNR